MPRYSIIIPTRQRHDTLYHSLRAALAIDYDDYEIVVQDNCSDERTKQVVDSLQSPKIVYQRSDTVLSMGDNWEMALKASSGDFITYVGDDDAVTLDACKVADAIFKDHDYGIVCWHPHTYWWPSTIAEWQKNILYIEACGKKIEFSIHDTKEILKSYYSFLCDFSELPMVYNSFVSRRVVDDVIGRVGSYFAHSVPDLYSGIAHCIVEDEVLFVHRPLSVRGISGHSNGAAHVYSHLGGDEIRKQFSKENPPVEGRLNHPSLSDRSANSIYLGQAHVMAFARDDLFPHDETITIDIKRLIQLLINEIGTNSIVYDGVLAMAHQVASRNGYRLEDFGIPPKPPLDTSRKVAGRGPVNNSEGKTLYIGVDGNLAGISDIYGAIVLVDAMTSKVHVR